ncbi:MAG TPA: ATP-binding protein [Rhodothermales bacterium]|nr:ATP-binding protein [Rhodothermales bacterium]
MLLHHSATPERTYFRRRYAGIVVFLLLMLPLTLGLRAWQVSHLRRHVDVHQERAVSRALSRIEKEFEAARAELADRAEHVAEAQAVRQSLRNLRIGTDVEQSHDRLADLAAELDVAGRDAVEIYDAGMALQAWKGYSLPPSEASGQPGFLQDVRTTVVQDRDLRQALVVWHPVRATGHVVGAVRAMRLISARTPVQNEYLHSFSLAERWSQETGLQVAVQLSGERSSTPPENARVRLLTAPDGTVLARVYVQPPTEQRLLELIRGRFNDVLVFWATLLCFWIVAGLWLWYARPGSRPPVVTGSRERRAWMRALGRFAVVSAAWWGVRFVLLAMDVPSRWQPGKAPLAPLFDPAHMASALGGGLLRSTGDLLITALFALAFAVAWVGLASRFRDARRGMAYLRGEWDSGRGKWSLPVTIAVMLAAVLCTGGLVVVLGLVARHVVLDSTLDYFLRSGLFPPRPERLLLVIFGALLLLTVSLLVVVVGLMWIGATVLVWYHPAGWRPRALAAVFLAVITTCIAALYLALPLEDIAPWPVAGAFVVLGAGLAVFGRIRREQGLGLLSLRGVCLSVFTVCVLLYPIFYGGMDARRRTQIEDASASFSERRDPRIIFAIEQVLEQARSGGLHDRLRTLLAARRDSLSDRQQLDSLAEVMLSGSFLTSLGPYDVSLSIMDVAGRPAGRYYEADQAPATAALDEFDAGDFDILRQMYAESGASGIMVEQITGRLQRDRFQYVGIVPIRGRTGERVGWAMARAESQTLLQNRETPFPRVLLPTGYFRSLEDNLSLAEFRNGVLVRSLGRNYGQYALDEEVRQALVTDPEFWRTEQSEGRAFLTLYRREEPSLYVSPSEALPPVSSAVVAVRAPAVNTFDHLYYLLRLTIAGLFLGLPIYLIGTYVRWRMGLLPAAHVRFQDKVLNAFLGVGIVAVAAMGIVGQQVVQEETEGAERASLRGHLQQVEQILALRGHGGELPYRVLSRTDIDSVAAVIGADVNVYRNDSLVQTTRPQLVRDRLISARMPIEAYDAIYLEGHRTVFVGEQIGAFQYRSGYHALLDETGEPQYVIAIPTLPDQERIEEERARTTAYLFGALLLLLLIVMLTAALVADALARPIGRLRTGLEAVARGQFDRKIPVVTRDEVGDLVRTFNDMQEQLAESRRTLAQQERQLAWREMARQVAHEIKNPLTPMKLSVQHLRRAFGDIAGDEPDERQVRRFSGLFDRITSTLIEQIDALARIANEFHSFARMPTRMMERLDLNVVVQEAVSLMQEESSAAFTVQLSEEPLVVEADREELRRIYINLIKNALQAIPEDREGEIGVETRLDGIHDGVNWALSAVTDNGAGVPAELRERIFQPNFSTKTSGTGLGLAIVQKGVEEMKGEIDFETAEGQGSTFKVRFPLAEEEDEG